MKNAPRILLPALVLAVMVLAGYHDLFQGCSLFIENDPLSVFDYASGNALGNGWRPDLGLGVSAFFGDPGVHHAWSVFSLVQGLAPQSAALYEAGVLCLLMLAALSVFLFLKRTVPGLSEAWAVGLSLLAVFCPLQHEFYFQRLWIALTIGAPWIMLVLQDHFSKKSPLDWFRLTFLLWFTFFFGGYPAFLQTLVMGLAFTVLHLAYHRAGLKPLAACLGLHVLAVAGVVLLGMWVFYSVALEARLIDYVRDSVYFPAGLAQTPLLLTEPGQLVNVLTPFLHSGLLPYGTPLARLLPFATTSWQNVSPVFPIVLACVLLRREPGFWPFALKGLVLIFYAHQVLFWLSPVYQKLLFLIFQGYPLGKFQPGLAAVQVAIIGLFAAGIARREDPLPQGRIRAGVVILLAAGLLALYAALLAGAAALLNLDEPLVRDWAARLADLLRPASGLGPGEALGLLNDLAVNFQTKAGAWYFLFLGSCLAFFGLFLIPGLRRKILGRPAVLVGLLLFCNLAMSWSVYPLNDQPLVWSGVKGKIPAQRTDRFCRFNVNLQTEFAAPEPMGRKKELLAEYFRTYSPRVGGPFPPGLRLCAAKGFTQKAIAEYLSKAFENARPGPLRAMRELGGPLAVSPRMNAAAVNRYYALDLWRDRDNYKTPAGLAPELSAYPLFVYQNPDARPYFRLVSTLPRDPVASGLGQDDPVAPLDKTRPAAALARFEYGRLDFECQGDRDGVLVVADAWHPFWKAYVDGRESPVLKADEVFKAVAVPAGRHAVDMVFDTSPYWPGVYVSIAAWLIFGLAWLRLSRRKRSGP